MLSADDLFQSRWAKSALLAVDYPYGLGGLLIGTIASESTPPIPLDAHSRGDASLSPPVCENPSSPRSSHHQLVQHRIRAGLEPLNGCRFVTVEYMQHDSAALAALMNGVLFMCPGDSSTSFQLDVQNQYINLNAMGNPIANL